MDRSSLRANIKQRELMKNGQIIRHRETIVLIIEESQKTIFQQVEH